MNNSNANELIESCEDDLIRIEKLIEVLTSTNPAVPYLTKYAIIKTCGTIEQCFKIIISEVTCINQNKQVVKYISKNFKNNSINPNLNNIHKSLEAFDEDWNEKFKLNLNNHSEMKRLKSSLQSLNSARNQFAHGGNPNLTFNDVKLYFEDAKIIIGFIDNSVQ